MKNIHRREQKKSPPTCQLRDFSPDFRTKGALKAYPANVSNSFHTTQSPLAKSDKLKKKCCVVIERNDELEEHEREKAAYINNLLKIQREKRRQALEKKHRQDEERERLLREKAMEAKRIKDEIQELRRQQEEKNRYRAEEQMLREREKEFRDRLLKERHRRYQLMKRSSQLKRKEIELVRLRKVLPITAVEVISSVSTTVLPTHTTKTVPRQRSETVDERWLTSTTKDFTDSIMTQFVNSRDSEEVLNNTIAEPSVHKKEVRPSTPENCTINAKLSTDVVVQETTSLPSMQIPKVSEEKMSPKSAMKLVKVRLKRMFIDKYCSEKASEEMQEQCVHQDTVKMDTKMRERMLKAKNKLKAQLEKIEHMQKETSEINPPNPAEITNLTNHSVSHLSLENKCQQPPTIIFEEENVSETPNAAAEIASSSLALLANTAATARIAETNTNNNEVKIPSEPLDLPKLPSIVKATISKTPNRVIAEEKENYLQSPQKLPALYRISENDKIVEKNEEDIRKEPNLRLINFEATPTVPTYLFNGESRDVPTPTPPPLSMLSVVVASTVPATFESAVAAPSEQTEVSITTTANANNLALFTTSDHEVSSTQETLCESLKRNASHLTHTPTTTLVSTQATTTIPVATSDVFADAASVQNNEIDTTDRLPENSTTIRRRTRKFSTLDESLRNGNFEHMKRRKTICAESTYRLQSSTVEINFSGNATSPSTTTNPLEKLPSRRRVGRTAKLSAVTNAIKKLQRSVSTSTPPNATEDTAGRALHCNSPGVLTLVDTEIKHTYSKNNSVQNVFVPPEIEKCLEQETHEVKTKASSVSAKALKKQKKTKRSVGSAIKEKGNTMLKTFRGAKMKLIETRSADIKPVPLVKLKAKKVHTLLKLPIPSSGRRKR